ncbi:hypothetical protein [Acinetobacter larvae]|uniref:Uncharacterized protein n=1 Tax=Acinetobacter larvae TaxID=1789224 RepID=A0A1B2M338_9GAMM|nr:hypothetical protein [Acinetobacter larvae]AOA59615.1 hypothetical protein BFG52_15520 [Acinetobacter larvae]
MGLGYGAGAGAFIVILLLLLDLTVFFALCGYWYTRHKHFSNVRKRTVLVLLALSSILPLLAVSTSLSMLYQNYRSDQAERKIQAQQIQQLSQDITFGEIVIPQGSWINRDGSVDFPLESLKDDPRLGLQSVRFKQAIKIAGIQSRAFAVHHDLVLELAEDVQLNIAGQQSYCPKGWLLQLARPTDLAGDVHYQSNFAWFQPSQWQIELCFDAGQNGVMVLARDQQGVFVLNRDI